MFFKTSVLLLHSKVIRIYSGMWRHPGIISWNDVTVSWNNKKIGCGLWLHSLLGWFWDALSFAAQKPETHNMMDLGAGSSRAPELSSGRLGMESWAESPTSQNIACIFSIFCSEKKVKGDMAPKGANHWFPTKFPISRDLGGSLILRHTQMEDSGVCCDFSVIFFSCSCEMFGRLIQNLLNQGHIFSKAAARLALSPQWN